MKPLKKNTFSEFQKRCFDSFANSYETNKEGRHSNRAMQFEIQTILKYMPRISTATILDVGCGVGTLSIPLSKKAKKVLGVDISEESIRYANQRAKKLHLTNFTAVCRDIFDFPSKEKFDYILVVNVVHHVSQPEKFLSVLREHLKKDGRIILFENNPFNILFYLFFIINGYLRMHLNKEYFQSNLFSLKSYIKKAKLDIVGIERYAFFPTLLYNYSSLFITLNKIINQVPFINTFCAFHIIECEKAR